MTSAPEWNLPLISQALSWVAVAGAPALPADLGGDAGYWSPPPAGADRPAEWVAVTDEEIEQAARNAASAIVNLIPYVGDAKGLIELFHGQDLISGEKLVWWERALGAAGVTEVAAGARGLKTVAGAAEVLDAVDVGFDVSAMNAVLTGPLLVAAVETLRSGADIEALDWRNETTAVVEAGVQEAARLTAAIQAQHPLEPATASQVTEILAKTLVRQAQADGLLPRRLQVLASAAEGGDGTETIDLWDPKTGLAWDLTATGAGGSGASEVGRTMTSGGARVTITEVVPVRTP